MSNFKIKKKNQKEGRAISIQNLNEYIGTNHLESTQFCHLPGSLCKTWFLKCLSLLTKNKIGMI